MRTDPSSTKFNPQSIQPFSMTLSQFGLNLTRSETTTLQVNVGFLCNQVCKHCHLGAGPDRAEIMDRETVEQVVNFAKRSKFQVIDITGGAPELNPNLAQMIEQFSPLAPRIMLRTNLTALYERDTDQLLNVLTEGRVALVASLPSLNASSIGSSTRERKLGEKSCDPQTVECRRIWRPQLRPGVKSCLQSYGSVSAGVAKAG